MDRRNKAARILATMGSVVLFAAAVLHFFAGYAKGFPALAASNLKVGLQTASRVVFLSVGWAWARDYRAGGCVQGNGGTKGARVGMRVGRADRGGGRRSDHGDFYRQRNDRRSGHPDHHRRIVVWVCLAWPVSAVQRSAPDNLKSWRNSPRCALVLSGPAAARIQRTMKRKRLTTPFRAVMNVKAISRQSSRHSGAIGR